VTSLQYIEIIMFCEFQGGSDFRISDSCET
jgi:hypothetical protein